jgi:hypothetical protein
MLVNYLIFVFNIHLFSYYFIDLSFNLKITLQFLTFVRIIIITIY